jgi:hypothetical protein
MRTIEKNNLNDVLNEPTKEIKIEDGVVENTASPSKNMKKIPDMPRTYKRTSCKRVIKRLIGGKQNFLMRSGSEVTEIIYGKKHFMYASANKNIPSNKLFLFKMVKRDALKFTEKNPIIVLPPKQKTQNYNLNYDETKGVITGTDLNHAFWRIAYVKGYISEKTYLKGLEDDNSKTARLATLGVLGTQKSYDEYREGEFFQTIVKRKQDQSLLMVYKDIRYTCYYMMYVLSQKLGDDFESWATDCIYYRDSPENRKLVHDFFDAHGMLYKQLSFEVDYQNYL